MPFVPVADQAQDQNQPPSGKFVPVEQPDSGNTASKIAGAGLIGAGAGAALALLRRRFPGLGMRGAQAFLDSLHGAVSKEITPGGLPALGSEYREFVSQLGRTDPNTVPTFADFLASKGVKAPETMKLIEQAQSAGPITPSQSAESLISRDQGAQRRTLDAYVQQSSPRAAGALSMRLRPDFWKQDPEEFANQLAGLPPEQQAALQGAVRDSLGRMPFRQFSRRFLGTDPAYAQDRAIFQATLPEDARTRFVQQLKAEQMMHKGAIDFTAPGAVPGSGTLSNPVDSLIATHEAVSGGFHPISLALRLLRGPAEPPESGMRFGNRLLFDHPDAAIEPGVGADPGSYRIPALDSYSPSRRWMPDLVDAGVGLGAGAIDYGLESADDQR